MLAYNRQMPLFTGLCTHCAGDVGGLCLSPRVPPPTPLSSPPDVETEDF
jgi:hypothetical protein